MTMKTWIVVLIIAVIGLLVFLWRRRERFATGSIQPICPEDLILVGKKCRGAGADNITGECPGGMTMNEEGMCQRLEDPTCPADYTLAYDDFSAMCEPNTPIQQPSDEEMYARQQGAAPPPPATEAAPPPPPPPVTEAAAPPPVVTPSMIAPRPPPREIVFQPKLTGTPGGSVLPADTRIRELLGGLFSPSEPRQEPSPGEYIL